MTSSTGTTDQTTRRRRLLLVALAAAVLVCYTAGLTHTPAYLHEAEVLFGLHAHAIATTAHDTNGRLLPLYFQMPEIGENVWFQPAIVYFTVPFLAVLPPADWVIRLPSVFVALADILLMFFVARRIFGHDRGGWLAAILLALTPAHFIHGRIAMDYLYPVAFVLGWLLTLLIYLERPKASTLFLATSMLGLGVYSYLASLIMMPLYLAMTWLVLWMAGVRSARTYATAVAGFAWPLLIAVAWIGAHPHTIAQTLGRYQVIPEVTATAPVHRTLAEVLWAVRQATRFSGITGRVSLYWYFQDPAYLFLTGGYANVINSTRHVGVFLVPFLALIPLGLFAIAVTPRRPAAVVVALGFITAPLAACLVVPEPYAVDRELEVLAFGVLAAVFGLEYLLAHASRLPRAVAIGLLALVPFNVAFFCYDYFVDYRGRSAIWFEANHRDTMNAVIDQIPAGTTRRVYFSTRTDPYMLAYWRLALVQRRRPELQAVTTAFDTTHFDVDTIPAGSLIVATRSDPQLLERAQTGAFKTLAVVSEPADPPNFFVLER